MKDGKIWKTRVKLTNTQLNKPKSAHWLMYSIYTQINVPNWLLLAIILHYILCNFNVIWWNNALKI